MKRGKKFFAVGLICILFWLFNACGAMMGGGSTEISLTSKPDKVQVEIKPIGKKVEIAATVKLKNNQNYIFIAKKEGYKEQQQTIKKEMRTDALVCDILWFLPGLIPGAIAIGIDLSSGGLYKLDKDHIHFIMEPKKPAISENTNTN